MVAAREDSDRYPRSHRAGGWVWGCVMRYAIILRGKPNLTMAIGVPRRMGWNYPEGLQVEAEYWPATSDPAVFVVVQAEEMAPLIALTADWDDLFDITITPCLTAEEGLAIGAQLAPPST